MAAQWEAGCPGTMPHGCSVKLVFCTRFHFLPLHPLSSGASRAIFQSRAYAPGVPGVQGATNSLEGQKKWCLAFPQVTGSRSSELVCDGRRRRPCEELMARSLPRLGPICRAGAGPPRYPTPLHRQVSPADHGLPGEGLLRQTAGKPTASQRAARGLGDGGCPQEAQ